MAAKYIWLLILVVMRVAPYLCRQTDDDTAADNDILFHAGVQNMTINAFLLPLLLCAVLYQSLLPPTMDI